MANTSSAKKAIRSNAAKKERNDVLRDNMRSARRELTKAVSSGSKEVDTMLANYYKQVDKAAKGSRVFNKKKAARLKSRAAATVAAKK